MAKVSLEWCTEDVQSIRPDLTEEQAKAVLEGLRDNEGVTAMLFDALDTIADDLYPVVTMDVQ